MKTSRFGRRSSAAMALLAATCLTPVVLTLAAPGDPRGAEFQVNSYATQRQAEPAVAMDRGGDFVVVWQSNFQDGLFYGIYAQRYNALGVTQGAEFRVNVTTGGSQSFPAVAMDDDGNFVVVWESYQDGGGYGVYARRYDAAGAAQGGEFRVNATTAGDQRHPAVAMDADGDFVVAWQGPDSNGYGVYARRYDTAGAAQGGEVLVNTHVTDDQDRPAVAMDAGGDFVVAWEDFTHDGDGWGIFAQRYDGAGVAQGGNFVVNSQTFSWQNRPSVAMDAGGGFAVSWHDTFHEGDGRGLFVRRFDAAGAALGADGQVNTYTTLDQDYPAIASNAYGDLIVAWRSDGQDTDQTGIFAQRISGQDAVSADLRRTGARTSCGATSAPGTR